MTKAELQAPRSAPGSSLSSSSTPTPFVVAFALAEGQLVVLADRDVILDHVALELVQEAEAAHVLHAVEVHAAVEVIGDLLADELSAVAVSIEDADAGSPAEQPVFDEAGEAVLFCPKDGTPAARDEHVRTLGDPYVGPPTAYSFNVPTRQASDRLVRWPGGEPACVPVILTVSTPTPDRIAPAPTAPPGRCRRSSRATPRSRFGSSAATARGGTRAPA